MMISRLVLLACLSLSGAAVHAQTPFFPGVEAPVEAEISELAQPDNATDPEALDEDAKEEVVQEADQPENLVEEGEEAAVFEDAYRLHLMASGPAVFSTSNASYTYPFFIEEKGTVQLSVGIETGAGLASQNSSLTIYLNEAVISQEDLSPDMRAQALITLPENLVRAGRNEIRINVRQHNGMCAVGENVWARLNPALTYVEFEKTMRAPGWINPGPDAFIDVAYVRSGQDEKTAGASIITAAMRVSAKLPRVRIRPEVYDEGDDLGNDVDLVVLSDMSEYQHPTAKVINMQQIDDLSDNAMSAVVDVAGGEEKELRDFGLVVEGWEDDRYAKTLLIRIPDTFLSMSSGNMRFVLNGRSEQKLSAQSKLTVLVNNQISSSVSIPPRWNDRNSMAFDVPMRHMRPGLNKMEIVIETPSSVCGVSSGGKMALFGDSTIKFPKFGEAQRLSIFSLLSEPEEPIYVVSDKMGKAESELIASIMSRMVRSVDHIPVVEVVPPSDWLNSKNALILSTGEENTRGYEPVFGMDLARVEAWRTSIRQRLMDIADISDEEAAQPENTNKWAREAYAGRNVAIGEAQNSVIKSIGMRMKALLDTDAIDLRGNDLSFLVARRAPENGIHVLFSVAEISQAQDVSGFISQSGPFLWDGRSAHVESDGDIRPYQDTGMPVVTNKNPANLRLVFADIMSTQYHVYLILIVFVTISLSILTHAMLKKKDT